MADKTPTGPVELGAEMDYAEHEKTYSLFLNISKYLCIICAALLIAMACGFFAGFGLISSTLLFVIIVGLGSYLLR
ncbi:aa3-type cytochrome c oxidase subunit IV [Mesorhizobium xinjiangense]|uniref:aa3-type cytochrome c oxidase subunit IV n=1 Tax=Mesorhizobium xinjiangense TaxID=2678685 RepID=UPI0012ED1CB5|nr:aa3-type cytochrome c oxidase subunit IV [Mesorhizobium xinjiangense]